MENRLLRITVWAIATILFILLSICLLFCVHFTPTIDGSIQSNLIQSGVSHDVTAVLLNFRALDTLLEIGVIFLALLAISALKPYFYYKLLSFESKVTDTFVAFLFPIIALSAFYILYIGSYKSGGAFGASALLAGGIIVLRLVKPKYFENFKESYLRMVYTSGLLFFASVGIATLFFGSFLHYRNDIATLFIISIETVLTANLAFILSSFFITATGKFR